MVFNNAGYALTERWSQSADDKMVRQINTNSSTCCVRPRRSYLVSARDEPGLFIATTSTEGFHFTKIRISCKLNLRWRAVEEKWLSFERRGL